MHTDSNGNVTSVTLTNGEVIEADLVILGTGVKPNTQFL
jgi:NADPH-dependent 2,4-dienoyl-CoA reductase/sulfur reductase-like enzyme